MPAMVQMPSTPPHGAQVFPEDSPVSSPPKSTSKFSKTLSSTAKTSAQKRSLSKVVEADPKKLRTSATFVARAGQEADEAAIAVTLEEFSADFGRLAMSAGSRRRLAPLLQRWGKARAPQILGLWNSLGDGALRPVSAATLQIWGPPGSGKTAIVSDYLSALDIRHIRLNCATFTSLGELNARLIELLRRSTVEAADQAESLPPALQRGMPLGQPVRSLDKLEVLSRLPLDKLPQMLLPDGSAAVAPPVSKVKTVLVVDQAQELARFGAGAVELLISLPEVLQWGEQLAVVLVGRLPLGDIGLLPNRGPPTVAFRAYTEAEAEEALSKVLVKEFEQESSKAAGAANLGDMKPADMCSGLMKFAWPHLGRNLQQLLSVGRQMLREGLPEAAAGGSCGAAFQQQVLRAVQQRLGLCDLNGLLKKGDAGRGQAMDTACVSALVTLRQMTKAEMRLVLAAYLAGYVEKEDDVQLFMPEVRRKVRRKGSAKQQQAEAQPIYIRTPRPTSMSRLLAVYHRLARRPQLLGQPLLEHLTGLREAGLLRFPAERACLDQDMKVTCRAQLPLVRAIAGELNVDLAEYLTKY